MHILLLKLIFIKLRLSIDEILFFLQFHHHYHYIYIYAFTLFLIELD